MVGTAHIRSMCLVSLLFLLPLLCIVWRLGSFVGDLGIARVDLNGIVDCA